ncbi:MAG TPA: hypothetical protein VI603_02145 [Saprospiraceae bacterium]|nr:hypothetical protein [Saprospiraceae bacterium]
MKDMRKYHMVFSLIVFIVFGCTKEVVPEYSPYARLRGNWDLGVTVTSTPTGGGTPEIDEFTHAIKFDSDSKGTYYGIINYDFLWVVEQDPDILVISQFHPGFPMPTYTNRVYDLLQFDNCCNIRLRREYRDTVGGIEKDVVIDWMMSR